MVDSQVVPLVQFTVYGEAKAGGSKRPMRRKDGRMFVIDANPAAKPWKQEVAACGWEAMERLGLQPFSEALRVRFDFYFVRPAGHFGKNGLRASARPFPSVRPDALKLARLTEDALTGVVWTDDSVIVEEVLTKRYGTTARVEVSVAPINFDAFSLLGVAEVPTTTERIPA